jgi:hypothetical protein
MGYELAYLCSFSSPFLDRRFLKVGFLGGRHCYFGISHVVSDRDEREIAS